MADLGEMKADFQVPIMKSVLDPYPKSENRFDISSVCGPANSTLVGFVQVLSFTVSRICRIGLAGVWAGELSSGLG